jgi:hypothetical protein
VRAGTVDVESAIAHQVIRAPVTTRLIGAGQLRGERLDRDPGNLGRARGQRKERHKSEGG